MRSIMMYEFFIPGKLPNLNDYTNANRKNRYAGAKMKKDAEQLIGICIRNDLKGLVITEPVYIEYEWIEENKRRDLDNICFARKFVQDALVKTGTITNDGWKEIIGFKDSFRVDKGHSGVNVKIIVYEI